MTYHDQLEFDALKRDVATLKTAAKRAGEPPGCLSSIFNLLGCMVIAGALAFSVAVALAAFHEIPELRRRVNNLEATR